MNERNQDVFLNVNSFNPYANDVGQPQYPRRNMRNIEQIFNIKSATIILTIIQITIFIISQIVNQVKKDMSYTCILYHMGSKYTPSIRYDLQLWRLLTPIFLHASVFHLLANMISQVLIGFSVERNYGTIKYLYLYFTAGLCGNLVSALYSLYGTSVGASTSLFGLMGLQAAYLIKYYNRQNQFLDKRVEKNTIYVFCFFLFMNILYGLQPGSSIDMAGHFGGFVAGLLVGRSFMAKLQEEKKEIAAMNLILWGLIIGMFIAIFLIDLKDRSICM